MQRVVLNILLTAPFGPWLPRLLGLVPDVYASYRPLILDGLVFFLSRLSPARLESIVADQARLPPRTPAARRLQVLFLACPTLHKLGQVVAHDRRLSPALRKQLQALESLPPSPLAAQSRAQIRHLRACHPGLSIGAQALAEGSVAVVVPFEYGSSHGPRQGVFKLLRPGVAEKLEEELPIWNELGGYLEQRSLVYGVPVLDYRNVLNTVARLLRNEVDFAGEQANLRAVAEFHARSPDVLIPRLLPFCTPTVTAMERVFGAKVTEARDEVIRRRQAERMVRALLARPFWQRDGTAALFHADPHAGNILTTTDGRLALLDWALIAKLPRNACESIVQIVLAAWRRDHVAICSALDNLGTVREPEELAATVTASLRAGFVPGFDWLLKLFDTLAAHSTVRFAGDLLLFRKAVLTLQGVVGELVESSPFDDVLIAQGLGDLLASLPCRGLSFSPWQRGAAHLANTDLAALWLAAPVACFSLLARSPR